jgi:hypothetical protein
MIHTGEVSTVWARMRTGMQHACGGIVSEFADATLATGPWQAWPVEKGVFLTRCLASQLPEDDRTFTTVRLTFVARYCPGAPPDKLETLSSPCEEAEVVPQPVKEALDRLVEQFEREVKR